MVKGYSTGFIHPPSDSTKTKSQMKEYILKNFSESELTDFFEELVLELNKRKDKNKWDADVGKQEQFLEENHTQSLM